MSNEAALLDVTKRVMNLKVFISTVKLEIDGFKHHVDFSYSDTNSNPTYKNRLFCLLPMNTSKYSVELINKGQLGEGYTGAMLPTFRS